MSKHSNRAGAQLPGVPMQACPPGVDPAEAAILHIEAMAEKDGWDEPTTLYLLYAPDPDGILVAKPPLRQSLGRMDPPDMLDLLGANLHRAKWASREHFYGAVVVCEAWGATADMSNAVRSTELLAAANERRIYQQPDRYEMRVAYMAAIDGRHLMVSRIRSENPALREAGEGEGRVPEALARFVTTAAAAHPRTSDEM